MAVPWVERVEELTIGGLLIREGVDMIRAILFGLMACGMTILFNIVLNQEMVNPATVFAFAGVGYYVGYGEGKENN